MLIRKIDGYLNYKSRYGDERKLRLACEQMCQEQTTERHRLTEESTHLSDRITELQQERDAWKVRFDEGLRPLLEERDNLKAQNADLIDEIARLKHKKLPSKADNVVAQS